MLLRATRPRPRIGMSSELPLPADCQASGESITCGCLFFYISIMGNAGKRPIMGQVLSLRGENGF